MKVQLTRPVEIDGRRVRTVSLKALGLGDLSRLRAAHARMTDAPEAALAEMIAIATGISEAAVLALPMGDIVKLMEAVAEHVDSGVSKIVGAAPPLPLSSPAPRRH